LIFIFIKDRKIKEVAGIICFYLGSHLILDIFDGGIFLLYPFYNKVFYSVIELIFNGGIIFNVGISNHLLDMRTVGEPMISSENVGVAVLLIIALLLSIVVKMKNKISKYE
jgi:hypothetical protein